MKKVLTATDIAMARKAGQTSLAVPAGAIITPQAADDAREFDIVLVKDSAAPASYVPAQQGSPAGQPAYGQQAYGPHAIPVPLAPLPLRAVQGAPNMPRILTKNIPLGAPPVASQAYAPYAAPAVSPGSASASVPQAQAQASVAEEVRRQVVARLGNAAPADLDAVISAVLSAPACAAGSSGSAPVSAPASAGHVVHVSASALPAANVGAVPSAVSMVEAAAPSAALPGLGYMSWENSSFSWTFEHADVLVVLEGQLTLSGSGILLAAGPGDALLVPAGVAVTLSATGRVRCVHSSWPNPETRKG